MEKKLEDSGLVISKEVKQYDVIYIPANKPNIFSETKEGNIVLRIRRENDSTTLNLKKQKSYEMDNIEYETKINDPEAMQQILLLLGWKPEVEVKKTRKKGKLGEYEVCLDRVEGLGDFIELEKITDDHADPEEVRDELFKALKIYGLSRKDEETKGYDTQMYQIRNN